MCLRFSLIARIAHRLTVLVAIPWSLALTPGNAQMTCVIQLADVFADYDLSPTPAISSNC